MNNNSPQKALLVVFAVALVCSILVSLTAVLLKPLQQKNQLVERSRNVISLTGLVDAEADLSDDELIRAVEQLDIRVVDIDAGVFEPALEPADIDSRSAANDPAKSAVIPQNEDIARLGRRARHEIIYLVWNDAEPSRVIFPIRGQGMWSTIYGYIALEQDLNTIAAVSFYEQAETAGLGDQILDPAWQAQWTGRRLFDDDGTFRFRIGPGRIDPLAPAALHQVDGLSGATVTGDAVTRMIAYWFGPDGYRPFLDYLRSQPAVRETAPGETDQGESTS